MQRRGSEAPGTSGANFDEPTGLSTSFNPHLLREGLRYAFHADLEGASTGGDDRNGIWGGIAPAVNKIARSTDTTDAGPLTRVNTAFGLHPNGSVSFSGALGPASRGIFAADGATITRLFGQGDEVPGTGEIFAPGAGANVFSTLYYHTNVGLSFDTSLATSEGVWLPGDVLFLGGSLYHRNQANLPNNPALLAGDRIVNGQGRVLESGVSFGVSTLFLGSSIVPATFTIVAQVGMQAPGLPQGIVFASGGFFDYGMNDTGIIVFSAAVSGQGITSENDDVLYLYDPNKEVYQLLGRAGTEMVIDGGESFTPRFSPDFTDTNGNASGLSAGINNRNEIVFTWRGTDLGDRLVLVTYDPDAVVISRRPDVSVGGVGTERFSPVAQDRSAKLRRSAKRGATFPVVVAQSGNAPSVMRLALSGNFKAARVKTALTHNGANVTAAAATGNLLTPELTPGESWVAELKVVADKKKTRIGHNYLARITATASDNSTDTAGIRLKVVK